MTGLIDLRAATTRYNGKDVLVDVALSVEAGDRIALVGKSGAGKSTLLKVIYGQLAGDCALIPQDCGLVRNLTVFHNIYMGSLHRHPTWYNLLNLASPLPREIDQVREILDRLGLSEKLFARVGELSGGEQQRTCIGRALFQLRPVLIGDEPVSALDAPQANNVLSAIMRTHQTMLLALHDVELALRYCSRILGLRGGRLVLDEQARSLSPEDLRFLYT